MREIKFRVWDKKRKLMWSHRMLLLPITWEELSTLDYLLDVRVKRPWDFDPRYNNLEDILPTDNESPYIEYAKKDFVLMQYTGRKDKNGKKIYEGDIVEINLSGEENVFEEHDEESGIYPVQWLRWSWLLGGWDLYRYGERHLRVLGNIYEHTHPQLLNGIYQAIKDGDTTMEEALNRQGATPSKDKEVN